MNFSPRKVQGLALPKHKCGLYLTHNEHHDNYVTATKWLQDQGENYSWRSELSKRIAIATDSIWVLQWYPDTPLGFHCIAAPTLEELLAWVAELEEPS